MESYSQKLFFYGILLNLIFKSVYFIFLFLPLLLDLYTVTFCDFLLCIILSHVSDCDVFNRCF